MAGRGEPQSDSYDVLVIGAGIGGLVAGGLLAKAGQRVLVVEREARAGGCARSMECHGLAFDSALHMIGGCEQTEDIASGLFDRILQTLGSRQQCEFLPVNPFYRAVYPELVFDAPAGRRAFIDAHAALFPEESDGIHGFFELCTQIRQEVREYPPNPRLWMRLSTHLHSPALASYGSKTLAQVLARFIKSSQLRALLSTMWPCLGVPPSRLSFVYFSMILLSYLDEGVYYCRDGFQRLADALVYGLERQDGELLLGTSVQRITVSGDRVTGVLLDSGRQILAGRIISNADVDTTFKVLLASESAAAASIRQFDKMERSLSAVMAYVKLKGPVADPLSRHQNFAYGSWHHDTAYNASLAAKPDSLVLCAPSVTDPGLAPRGQSVVSMMALLPRPSESAWQSGRDVHAAQLIELAESFCPGISDSFVGELSRPASASERYCLKMHGSISGWAMTPGSNRQKETVSQNRIRGSDPGGTLDPTGRWRIQRCRIGRRCCE